MYTIESAEGLGFWRDGWDCFGVREVCTEYIGIDDLPSEIDGADIEIFSDDPDNLDIRYYRDGEDDPIAVVVLMK